MFYEGTAVGVRSRQIVAGANGEVNCAACAAASGKFKEKRILARRTPPSITLIRENRSEFYKRIGKGPPTRAGKQSKPCNDC